MEEYWCVAVPGHNHYPQLAGRGVAVGGCSPRRFQPHQCLGQCCGSPGPHNGTYQKAAAPRSVGAWGADRVESRGACNTRPNVRMVDRRSGHRTISLPQRAGSACRKQIVEITDRLRLGRLLVRWDIQPTGSHGTAHLPADG